jgi:hypothetical protein
VKVLTTGATGATDVDDGTVVLEKVVGFGAGGGVVEVTGTGAGAGGGVVEVTGTGAGAGALEEDQSPQFMLLVSAGTGAGATEVTGTGATELDQSFQAE